MGNAVQRLDYHAARRRPDKAIRQKNRHANNLGAYIQSVSIRNLERSSVHNSVEQNIAAEYATFGAQPFDQSAANSDTVFTDIQSWLSVLPRQQLAVGVVSCLCIGTLVGHQWSSFTNQHLSLGSSVSNIPEVVEKTLEKSVEAIAVSTVLPDKPAAVSTPADISIDRDQLFLKKDKEHLTEVDWLLGQIDTLKGEVDALNLETLDQNRELLNLELEVNTLQSQSVAQTETRVIYNFVNVPIGSSAVTPIEFDAQTQYVESDNSQEELDAENDRLLREYELERASYQEQTEVVYDPETGYSINPNYSGASDNSDYEEDEIVVYPPITTE